MFVVYQKRHKLTSRHPQPLIAFQHELGMVRRSGAKYSLNATDPKVHVMNSRDQHVYVNFFYSFANMKEALVKESGYPPDWFEERVRPQMNNIVRFLLASEKAVGQPRASDGRFQVCF
jgi:hypothetical protein